MVMKTHKLIWNILFFNQKSDVYGVFRYLGPLVLLRNANECCIYEFPSCELTSLLKLALHSPLPVS